MQKQKNKHGKAIKIANDPCHWKDRRKRVVDTVFQCN
jgi:hypothetical protein